LSGIPGQLPVSRPLSAQSGTPAYISIQITVFSENCTIPAITPMTATPSIRRGPVRRFEETLKNQSAAPSSTRMPERHASAYSVHFPHVFPLYVPSLSLANRDRVWSDVRSCNHQQPKTSRVRVHILQRIHISLNSVQFFLFNTSTLATSTNIL
jgi:hypothetical protein